MFESILMDFWHLLSAERSHIKLKLNKGYSVMVEGWHRCVVVKNFGGEWQNILWVGMANYFWS